MIRKAFRILGNIVPILLLLAYFIVVICFLNRWDSVTPITLIPFWLWTTAGSLVSLLLWAIFRNQNILYVFGIWLVSGIAFSYETRGMAREMAYALSSKKTTSLSDRDDDVLRIISINCGDGNIEAARSVISYDPDIVFLQKAPLLSELTEVATKIYGVEAAYIRSHTNAILARGEFLTSASSPDHHAEHARLRLTSGRLIDLTNVELPTSLPSFRFWEAEKWKLLVERRKDNRKRVRDFLENYDPLNELPPRIVGGDFGTSPGDDIFRPFERAGLKDSYYTSGSDWGNTYPARTPFFRHTQFWISEDIEPVRVRSIRIKNNDQKMVLFDFRLSSGESLPGNR